MQIHFVTTNNGKYQTLQRDLAQYGIEVVQAPIELMEPQLSDVQDIAGAKIRQAYALTKKPTMVCDVGFYIPSLNGFPKAYTKFALETIGIKGILALLQGKDRNCEFRECLAYMDDKLQEPVYFIAYVKGKLAEQPLGTVQKHHWSELALLFIPEDCQKTHAEMTHEEYLQWREISKTKTSLGQRLYEWLSVNRN